MRKEILSKIGYAKGRLVTFKNTEGYHLDGILYQEDSNPTTIVHIHGSFGNFYQNKFIRTMAEQYSFENINFLSFNLTCHDGLAEGYRNKDEFEYLGGSIKKFDTCCSDIQGAVKFAKQFSDKIILQGHSLGCDRILHFLISKKESFDFILLSPCDSYQLQEEWIKPEKVEEQIKRLKTGENSNTNFEWCDIKEYGISRKDWNYPIPITMTALLSIIEGPVFKIIRINSPAKFYLRNNTLVYIGGRDALQISGSEEMFKYFEERIMNVQRVFFAKGDHNLEGCDEDMVRKIINWVKR